MRLPRRFNILRTFNMDEIIDLTWAKYDNRRSETKKHEKSKEISDMKKFIALAMALFMLVAVLTGCAGNTANQEITVVSREEGSGTRSAFIELTGVEVDDVDQTTVEAEISNSTAVVMQTVAGNTAAIGYISLGSLDETIKAVTVDGVEASVDNILNGTYPISRPFNVATLGKLTNEAAQDFLNYIMSDEGQAIITEEGYVSTSSTGAFTSTNPSGTVTLAGSSSVSPVMEKLAEAYMALNSNVTVQIQTSDSSTGMTSAIDGLCDIGMASRAVSDSELAEGLVSTTICMDGIAVVVNLENEVTNLTLEQIRQIFVGEITSWGDIA